VEGEDTEAKENENESENDEEEEEEEEEEDDNDDDDVRFSEHFFFLEIISLIKIAIYLDKQLFLPLPSFLRK